MSNFSFSFAGDDIDIDDEPLSSLSTHAAETGTLSPKPQSSTSAFPIPGQALIPPQLHSLESLLATLPSKIAYSTLNVTLDDGSKLKVPRRELWDVRVQLMAEGDDEALGTVTGKDDVRTGVYEGGFKSWESAVDLVRVLQTRETLDAQKERRKIVEVCSTFSSQTPRQIDEAIEANCCRCIARLWHRTAITCGFSVVTGPATRNSRSGFRTSRL
jgi:hypothetical protein